MRDEVRISSEESRRRRNAFDKMLLPHPRLKELREITKLLMEDTEEVLKSNARRREAAKGRSIIGEELWVLPIIGPSGATKTTSMRHVKEQIEQRMSLADDEEPILYVKLDQNTRNSKRLQVQILKAFGDPGGDTLATATQYSADLVDEDIRAIAVRRRTRIIVLDEAGNMLRHGGDATAFDMAKAIRGLANKGIFSVILMGTDKVDRLFVLDTELISRSYGDINFRGFNIKLKEDRGYFFKFIAGLEKRMLEEEIIDRPLGLVANVEDRAKVYDFAAGIIGIVPRVLRIALRIVLTQGRGYLTWDDVEDAFQAWNRPRDKDKKHYDPFENGPDKETVSFVRIDAQSKTHNSKEARQ
jgi:hypothetical protein